MENLQQSENGEYVEAKPLSAGCEHGEAQGNDPCGESKGGWYIRNQEDKDGSDWDTEPIYLCNYHSVNHEPTKVQ